jgi:hypothetical protein
MRVDENGIVRSLRDSACDVASAYRFALCGQRQRQAAQYLGVLGFDASRIAHVVNRSRGIALPERARILPQRLDEGRRQTLQTRR